MLYIFDIAFIDGGRDSFTGQLDDALEWIRQVTRDRPMATLDAGRVILEGSE